VAGVAGAIGIQGAGGQIIHGPAGMTISTGGSGSISTSSGANISIGGGEEAVTISNRTSAKIDIAKVQGQVHAQSVQKVGELAEKNPHEAVSIIRSWLHEEAA
jgi:flagellar M-ring protein FliF